MRHLRVGIDGYNLAMPNGTGVATYGFMLAKTLLQMGHSVQGVFGLDVGGDPDVREARFYETLARPGPGHFAKQPVRRTLDSLRLLWGGDAAEVPSGLVVKTAFDDRLPAFERLVSYAHLFSRAHAYFRATGRFAKLRMKDPPDLMHWTYPVPVRLEGAKNLYTIHDLVPLRLPFASLGGKQGYRTLIQACVDAADLVCTVSEASRCDILAHFPVVPERVINTYQVSSMDEATLSEDPAAAASAVEGMFGLKRDGYFLFFGAIEPKKNVGRLIEAYLSLETSTPLVIVAGRSWQSEGELQLIAGEGGATGPLRAHLAQRIIQIDYLPRRILMKLVRSARAVTFPSLYEGFGLPMHEAMLLGTPVLSSTAGAIPEIAGDAAVLVDPYDVSAIAAALKRLDGDSALRATLSERGPVQARLFSAERYQERLGRMYNGLMEVP